MVLVAMLPTSVHSLLEFFASLGPPVVTVAYLALVTFLLLKDNVAAWLLFGAFAFGGRGAVGLISQPAAPDQVSGGVGLALVLLAATVFLAGRRVAPESPDSWPQSETTS
jgi:hypothetical protein